MASLLDSVTVTRVFTLPITASISSASAAPSVPGRRISSPVRFLGFRGLKASPSLVTQSASLGANRRSRFARGGRIVSEAQDTTAAAVEGIYSLTFSSRFFSCGFLCKIERFVMLIVCENHHREAASMV